MSTLPVFRPENFLRKFKGLLCRLFFGCRKNLIFRVRGTDGAGTFFGPGKNVTEVVTFFAALTVQQHLRR